MNPLILHPLTPDRWSDFETLFGAKGACGGCWCMWWRLKRSIFTQQKGDQNKTAMKALVTSNQPTGILAYHDQQPVGWCSIAPRDDFPVLDNSRNLKRIDDQPVWSVVCLFVAKDFRRKGLTVELLKAAVTYAAENGAQIVEGYPVEPKDQAKQMPSVFAWTGFASAFEQAGFTEVLRRSDTRPIMRYLVSRD